MGETKTLMETVSDLHRDQAAVGKAAELLREGKLVILPTETVYGIGANALDAEAVSGIFAAKGRPQDNPLIVHVTSLQEVEPLVDVFPPAAKTLADRFWPGPLTLILPKSALVPPEVSGGLDTVAIRMPSHPVARAIIRQSGVPVAAPSANRSGSPSPTTAEHCRREMEGRVEMIVDGGDCNVGVESTVLSLAGDTPRLLRPGAVTLEQLQAVLGEIEVDGAVTHQLATGQSAASPGMKYKHYAPKTPLSIVHGPIERFREYVDTRPGAGAMVFEEDMGTLGCPCVHYGSQQRPEQQAQRLFAALWQLDELGVDEAFVRAPATRGMGLAIYNRLLRAAGFSEIYL